MTCQMPVHVFLRILLLDVGDGTQLQVSVLCQQQCHRLHTCTEEPEWVCAGVLQRHLLL